RNKYDSPEKALLFYDSALERLRNSPGVRVAGVTTNLPFVDANIDGIVVEGQEPPKGQNISQAERGEMSALAPRTLQAPGIPLLQGRDFQATDAAKAPLVVISDEPFVRRYWPACDALWKRVLSSGQNQLMTVGGIVSGVKQITLAEE